MEIVVGGILEKEGKYLLVQESKKKCYGKWNVPAGHLDFNENILEGAKREIFEECGCKVEITGLLKVYNKVSEDRIFLALTFSTNIIEGNVHVDKKEILDAKWFSYEEIVNMKDELRSYNFIVNAVKAHKEGKIIDLDIIGIEPAN